MYKRLVSVYSDYKVVWNIRGDEITIRIVDSPISSEDKFDWFHFDEELEDNLSSNEFRDFLQDNHIRIESHMSSGGQWSGKRLILEFESEHHYKNNRDFKKLIEEGDDKYRYKTLVERIKSFIKGHEGNVKLSIDFSRKGKIDVTDKVGLLKRKKVIGSFGTYNLEVIIEY